MPNKKISELSAAGALTGTELIETVQGGVNVQTTTQDIADLGGGGGTWGSITGTLSSQTDLQNALNDKSDAGATVSAKVGAYTLLAADLTLVNAGATLIIDGDSSADLTVPLNATIAFPVGSFIGVRDFNNVVATGGVTITGTNGGLTVPSGMTATLEKTATDTWILHNGAAAAGGTWGSITGTLADQTDLNTALGLKAPLASPTFTGTPAAPTAAAETDTTQIATTAFVGDRLSSTATKTDDYATVQTDNQKLIVLDAAITKTVTVDQLTANSYMSFVNVDVGQWNLTAGAGVTLYGSTTYLPGGEVNSITLWWLTATDVYVISGSSTSLNSLSVNGALAVRAGLSAGVIAKVGGVIYSSITTTGNVGGGEDDLFIYEVPSNTLSVDKASLHATAAGTFAANANNKRIRVRFGTTLIFDTTALALNAGDWFLEIQIFRTGAATQKTVCTIRTSNSTLYTTTDYTTAAVDLTTPLDLQVTAEATSDNDVVGQVFKLIYQPAE